jgi:ATP-dependent DNA helicase RecQ
LKRNAWQAIGRELLRLGLVECAPGKFATWKLTKNGLDTLRDRTPITLTKQIDISEQRAKGGAGEIECDEVLFERLRMVRRKLADERDVPAYVIFSDVSLREMARAYPTTASEFRRIPGVGEQKLKDFAEPFLSEIKSYLATNPRREFTEVVDSLTALRTGPQPRRSGLSESQLETLQRFRKGESVDQIARARGFVRSTIYGHLLAGIERGKIVQRDRFFTPAQEKEITAAFRQVSDGKLTDVSALLGGKYDISELRVFRAFAKRS